MTEFTKEYIQSVRMCSYLIEPPASEVVGILCDHIERLQKRVEELEQGLKNKCANCGLAIPHGIWGDEDNDYDNLPKLPQEGE